MLDREKVMKGLELCIRTKANEQCPSECPYRKDKCIGTVELMADALELLKESEAYAQEPQYKRSNSFDFWWFTCKYCGGVIDNGDRYCKHCGRKNHE